MKLRKVHLRLLKATGFVPPYIFIVMFYSIIKVENILSVYSLFVKAVQTYFVLRH